MTTELQHAMLAAWDITPTKAVQLLKEAFPDAFACQRCGALGKSPEIVDEPTDKRKILVNVQDEVQGGFQICVSCFENDHKLNNISEMSLANVGVQREERS